MFVLVTDSGYRPEPDGEEYLEEAPDNAGAQFVEGHFLILAEDPASDHTTRRPELRVLVVEDVTLEQCGQFMMGQAELAQGTEHLGTITLSGPFGADSLPCDLNQKGVPGLWEKMHPVPPEIQTAFWEDRNVFVAGWAQRNREELALWVIEAELVP